MRIPHVARSLIVVLAAGSGGLSVAATPPEARIAEDPLAWLEDLTGERQLAWVRAQNEKTIEALRMDSRFSDYYGAALEILTRPAGGDGGVTLRDGWVYRLFRDAAHPRGLWQRVRLDSYVGKSPQWHVLLDVDRLSRDEGTQYQFSDGAAKCLGSRCLVSLTPAGGSDFVEPHAMREFDVESRTFVKEGFVLPELGDLPIRRQAEWKDSSTLYVAANHWGPESNASDAGFMVIKEWSRGTPLAAAREIFRSPQAAIQIFLDGAERREIVIGSDRGTFRARQSGALERLFLPAWTTPMGLHENQWILLVLEDTTVDGRKWKRDSLVSIADAAIARANPPMHLMIEPSAKEVRPVARSTLSGVLVTTLENVRSRLSLFRFEGGAWHRKRIDLPDYGSIDFSLTASEDDVAVVSYESYLHPPTLYSIETRTGRVTPTLRRTDQFNARGLVLEQLWSPSRDGTRVPYFVVRPRTLTANGNAPTLLRAYGNNGAVMLPSYDPVMGKLWLEKGGVYVWASIRGGGELGQAWAVRKTERRRTYEDFVAVAEDLIRRGITSAPHLGIRGHSMGGCLVGVMLNERPDLFNAGISENGVLDQIGGYYFANGRKVYQADEGADDWGSLAVPQERAFLESTSPYQNLRKRSDAFPPLIMTSTNDGIPAFEARKYVARLGAFGMPYYFYESREAGHGFGSTPQELALHEALIFTYLAGRLASPQASQGR